MTAKVPGRVPRPGARRWLPDRYLVTAAVLGAASVLGYAPFVLFPLPVLALAGLLVLVDRSPSVRQAAARGFAFGLGLFLAGVSWVYVSLHTFGAMPAPLAAGTTLLFCAYLALFPAIAAAAARRCPRAGLRRVLVFPGAWTLAEWLRGWLFTGFPWLALGYSQAPASPLMGYAPLVGVFGVGLAAAAGAGLLVHAVASLLAPAGARAARMRVPAGSVPVAALALLLGTGWALRDVRWTEPEGEPVRVSLLQGNVPQSLKWRPEQVQATLDRYLDMIRRAEGRLIVLPETALPMFLQDVPPHYLAAIASSARARGADVLVGLPERGGAERYYNTVIAIGRSPPQRYRKIHLVPFGEFIPLRPLLAPIVDRLAIPLTDFSRGTRDQSPLRVAGQRVAVNICYEDVFGAEIAHRVPGATLLVNVSNVAWFGDSAAPAQHLQIARFRAVEAGRAMLRATNTGMTAAIEADGSLVAVAPAFEQAILETRVQGRTGLTPYVRSADAPALALAIALVLAGVRRRGAQTA